ncbi:MAG: carbohydrate ABC transporter permease [Acetatifactor sp.]|nr:carbohydrate ABC transporter permease [Acetatifactor sp.]MDE7354748.1 carbohydrate ABC transporter permease [Acetatifactor sp.]
MAKRIGKAATYFLLTCIGYIYLEPIFQMISKALMSPADVINPSIEWLARNPTLNNFKVAAGVLKIPGSLINSIGFSALLALLQTLVAAMTGYGLSRFRFRGRNFWFVMILLAFILPTALLMIPRLIIFILAQQGTGLQFLGTPIPQVLMAVLGQGVNSTILILICWNFFNLVPYSLDEAAMIDGAGPLQTFYHIAVKLSVSTVLIVFLFAFVWNWNETYQTSTFLGGTMDLLPAKLSVFDSQFEGIANAGVGSTSSFKINEAYKMAATLISIAPLLVLYGFVQKQFIQGIENTGITGE